MEEAIARMLEKADPGDLAKLVDIKNLFGMTSNLSKGTRVVRGPDWKWDQQDGGEGGVGTVAEYQVQREQLIVQWDHGPRANYRVGIQDMFDLCILDLAPSGDRHQGVVCCGCNEEGIYGLRYKCTQCADMNLCTVCYHGDVHDLDHAFMCITKQDSNSEKNCQVLGVRAGCSKLEARGLFRDAIVTRGANWQADDEDGGVGVAGVVTEITSYEKDVPRSGATVMWESENVGVFRVGYEGKTDLRCNDAANGMSYYKEHLPVFEYIQTEQEKAMCQIMDHMLHKEADFKKGDKVKLRRESFEDGPIEQPTWDEQMARNMQLIGTVVDIQFKVLNNVIVSVFYTETGNGYTIPQGHLYRVHRFTEESKVRIESDEKTVEELQKGHGGYYYPMRRILGKEGVLKKIDKDGDFEVYCGGRKWSLNPCCCHIVGEIKEEPELTRQDECGDVKVNPLQMAEKDKAGGPVYNLTISQLHGPVTFGAKASNVGGNQFDNRKNFDNNGLEEEYEFVDESTLSSEAKKETDSTPSHPEKTKPNSVLSRQPTQSPSTTIPGAVPTPRRRFHDVTSITPDLDVSNGSSQWCTSSKRGSEIGTLSILKGDQFCEACVNRHAMTEAMIRSFYGRFFAAMLFTTLSLLVLEYGTSFGSIMLPAYICILFLWFYILAYVFQ